MLLDFFLDRAEIEPADEGFRGQVRDLPHIVVTAPTREQCRAKLAGAIAALFAIEARRERASETAPAIDTQKVRSNSHSPSQSFAEVIYEKSDWIARVTIDRPAAYNAYTDKTLKEMTQAFRDAANDAGVAVLVLTGAGDRAFCAGGDVQQYGEQLDNPEALGSWTDALIEAHTALRQLGKPSIARINGMVAGGGNEWNLACDLAIAADHAKFVQIETRVGLVAAAGAAHWLPLFIGERRAREVFLTGEPISASKALLWGLVN